MKTYPFELTRIECTYLSDTLSMFAPGPPGAGDQGPYPDLLLKVLSAFLEVDGSGKPATVLLSQAELWAIREVAKSSATVASQPVGLALLKKTARGLLTVTAHDEVSEAVAACGETEDQEPGRARYEERLQDPALEKLMHGGKGGDADARDDHAGPDHADDPSGN